MPGDKATRERFALLDFDIPPAKAETPAPDPTARDVAPPGPTIGEVADRRYAQYAALQAMQNAQLQNNPYQQGLGGAQDFGNSLQNIQANALYGYAPIYPEQSAKLVQFVNDGDSLSALDRLRYLLAGREPPK